MENFKFLNKSKVNQLPKSPGVYAFKKGRRLLYIGKASNIRERVKNHNDLLNRVKQIGFIKTDSEIEALILEASLIKKYQPKYNVVWRDDKNYFFVAITKENFPRIFITHQALNNGGRTSIIGPFVDGKALKKTLRILRRVFPYYTIKKHPAKLCPWCHLKLCPGPNPKKKEYQKNIKSLIRVFQGKKPSVLKSLKKEMKLFSRFQDFEKAGKIRDQIRALEKIISHAKIFDLIEVSPRPRLPQPYQGRIEAYDVSNIQGKEATGSMITFIDGKPEKSQYRKFKIKIAGKPNDTAMIKEVLSRRFLHPEWPLPNLILIDGGKAQLNAALKIVKNIKVISLSKKENKLYFKNRKKPILLKSLSREIFNLILQLRDEAHRFAISYHKKLRENALFKR